jgi:hypothetical protein
MQGRTQRAGFTHGSGGVTAANGAGAPQAARAHSASVRCGDIVPRRYTEEAMKMHPWLAAVVACAAYVVGSLALGERFLFSRYAMYADLEGRSEGAVPVFLSGDRPVDPSSFDAFEGIDPEALLPKGIPCSTEYVVAAAQRWIAGHPSTGRSASSAVPFKVGYEVLRIEGGALHERLEIVAEGRAWPK